MTMTLGERALVGTSRAGTPTPTGTPIDALVEAVKAVDAVDAIDAAQRVLLLAAALDVYQRAGLLPSRVETLPEPAPADPRPACSAAAAAIVAEMIAGGHLELLREAFDLMARAGQRLPDPLLPLCLDLKEPDLRDAAHGVLGERGCWLARQRDRWSWAAGPAPAAVVRTSPMAIDDLRRTWEEGAIAHRLDAIAQVRASDPALAREWMATAWSSESAEDRVRLLGILTTRLGPDDEPWLESALKDRSVAVRARVALLLARLPDLAFAARAVARVDPLLAWEPASASGVWQRVKAIAAGSEASAGTLQVSPPTAADPAWEQDGISLKPPKGQGERGHWLTQLLAQVNPTHWSDRFKAEPRALVRAAWQSEWGSAILAGWARAAVLHGDTAGDWMIALWDVWSAVTIENDPQAAAARGELLAKLLARMPAEAAEERIIGLLRRPNPYLEFDPASAVSRFATGWSDRLASAVLDALTRVPGAALLKVAAYQLPPSHFERGLAIAVGQDADRAGLYGGRRASELFVASIHLRQRLYQELAR
jgi:hypothetical protein